jgi:hypothetical protein
MFLLHERTRKSLCKLGFLALCLLPTCAVALWAASRNGDFHRAACEAELSRLLRLQVTLGDVAHPEPGVVCYTDFVITHPETGAQIASAASIEVRDSGPAISVIAPQLDVKANGAGALAELLHDHLRDQSESGLRPVNLFVERMTIAAPNGNVPLLNVRGLLEPTSGGRGAVFDFRTAEMPRDARAIALTMVRSPDARIRFSLETHEELDPADRSNPIVPFLRRLVSDEPVLIPMTNEADALQRS